jgi:hypothetical protein
VLKFKTASLREQFYDLAQTDPRIRGVATELALWIGKLFDKDLIITCVWRTEEEQKGIYGQTKPSAHFCSPQCRAVDVRAHRQYFTPHELENIESLINKYFPRRDGFKPFLLHGEGNNSHIHLSVEPLQN